MDNFKFANLVNDYRWEVSSSKVAYNGEDQDLNALVAIFSTGTSLVLFESGNGDWDKIYNNITSGKTWGYSDKTGLRTCQCNGINDFKDISFTIGGHELTMKVNTWVRLESSGLCSLYIDSINYSDLTSTVILGYAFMKNYYIYYDINNTRIGFYPSSVDCDESLPEDCGQSSDKTTNKQRVPFDQKDTCQQKYHCLYWSWLWCFLLSSKIKIYPVIYLNSLICFTQTNIIKS